jgi:hypothetical protein
MGDPGARLRVAIPSLLCATTVLAGLVGCGGGTGTAPGSGDSSGAPRSSPGSDGTGSTALSIVVDDGRGGVTTWTLTCDPVGGNHPDAEAACRALTRSGVSALPPVPKDRLCTQVVGGPDVATVTGTWKGEDVGSRFNLRNGCEIARWKALAGLLPAVGR